MSNAKHILIAVDDSEASYHAVAYVGDILSGCEGFRVCLLHALPPGLNLAKGVFPAK